MEEDGVGCVFFTRTHDLAREDLDGRVICTEGASVIEGNVEAVLVDGVSVVSVRGRTHGIRVAPRSARRDPRSRLRAPFRLPLPEYHTKSVNVAGNKLCLLSTSCGGG